MAAAEGVNLQLAKAVIFYDTPWSVRVTTYKSSVGDDPHWVYPRQGLQLPCLCEENHRREGDEDLKAKMGLIEVVLGKRLKEEESLMRYLK